MEQEHDKFHLVSLQEAEEVSLARFIREISRPFRLHIILLIFFASYWAVDFSLRPYVVKLILDLLAATPGAEVFRYLLFPVLLYLGLSLVIELCYRVCDMIAIYIRPRLKRRVVLVMMDHLMGHSYTFYQNNFAGSLTNKVNDVAFGVREIIYIGIDRFYSHSLALAIAAIAFSQVDLKFTVLMMAWVAAYLSIMLRWSQRAYKLSDESSEASTTLTGKMVDILANMSSVRFFSGRALEGKHLAEWTQNVATKERHLSWFFFRMWSFQSLSFLALQAISLWFLMSGRHQGTVTPGDFALILTLNIHVMDCLSNLAHDFGFFTEYLGKINQGLRMTTLPHEIKDKPDAKDLHVNRGEIAFCNVTFQFKGATPLFQNQSVLIQAGQKVGLVGFSGSGKTTFVNLILRLFDIQSGTILIDGQDISMVTQDSLRYAISLIPQDPALFHRTLMDNIRYGKSTATDEEVIEAAKKAHAHEFISLLPEGYYSLAGERGVKLSGGQRQRIAIARAVLKNAPILILDEATSALDSVTENLIQDSITELMKDKTTLVIAHRLSTLSSMDRILVFQRGTIVEDGSHHELLAKQGTYAKLWQAQVGGFLPDNKKAHQISQDFRATAS